MLDPLVLQPWLRVDPLPVFDFPYHTAEVSYQEGNTVGATGGSYEYAAQHPPRGESRGLNLAPPLRTFTLKFPGLKYFLAANGRVSLTAQPQLNLALLDRFYQTHSLADQFLYPSPFYGDTLARFAQAFEVPYGQSGGLGFSESFEIKLVEVPTSLFVKGQAYAGVSRPAVVRIGTLMVFDFPFHRVSTSYRQESASYLLGGNYTFRTGRSKAEQRTFKLQFDSMRRLLTPTGKFELAREPQLNLGWLEYFYLRHRNTEPFYYPHPVYGNIKVRFKTPPVFPEGLIGGRGWTQPVEIELIEVM